MNRKKGFTLVELIAVIALLAVILLLVIPNVVKVFDKGKDGAFATLVQDIYKQAEKQFTEDYALDNYKNMVYCSSNFKNLIEDIYQTSCNPLNFNDETADYFVELDRNGKVVNIGVMNEENQCYTTDEPELKINYDYIEKGILLYDEDDNYFYCDHRGLS